MYWISILFLSIYSVSTENIDDVRDLQSAIDETLNITEIIRILCERNNSQVEKIVDLYQEIVGQNLRDVLNDKLSNEDDDFKYFILALLDTKPYFEAKLLYKAMKGLGTDEDVIIEILVSRTNEEIYAIRGAYNNLYDQDLIADLKDDTSGDLRDFLVLVAEAKRDQSNNIDIEKAKKDAVKLHLAGIAYLFNTDEEVINEILVKQNFDQLRLVFKEYLAHKTFGQPYHEIETGIWDETSGYIQQALYDLIHVIRNKSHYFASLIKSGDIKRIIRTIVSRSEIDLKEIVEVFGGGKIEFKDFIEKTTKGNLKYALITFLENQNLSTEQLEKRGKEFERLKEHLMIVEENSTREAVESEQRETELRQRVRELEASGNAQKMGASETTQQLQINIEELMKKLENVEKSREEWKEKYENVEKQRQLTAEQLTSLQNVVHELSIDHETDKSQSSHRNLELQTEIRNLKEEIEEIRENLERKTVEKQAAEEENERKLMECEQKQKIIEQLENQIEELRAPSSSNLKKIGRFLPYR
ncbi:unnamed protein product [Caenorhabditis angaria]|uniref:Annexin n=1 Tax=Caenorhabditis angaria TaxID=860376 RepID=A0A9P1MZI4_9PELO|nr:unnamed protein product [Caenorhabditis angaria]